MSLALAVAFLSPQPTPHQLPQLAARKCLARATRPTATAANHFESFRDGATRSLFSITDSVAKDIDRERLYGAEARYQARRTESAMYYSEQGAATHYHAGHADHLMDMAHQEAMMSEMRRKPVKIPGPDPVRVTAHRVPEQLQGPEVFRDGSTRNSIGTQSGVRSVVANERPRAVERHRTAVEQPRGGHADRLMQIAHQEAVMAEEMHAHGNGFEGFRDGNTRGLFSMQDSAMHIMDRQQLKGAEARRHARSARQCVGPEAIAPVDVLMVAPRREPSTNIEMFREGHGIMVR
jgi:hypothetical protein